MEERVGGRRTDDKRRGGMKERPEGKIKMKHNHVEGREEMLNGMKRSFYMNMTWYRIADAPVKCRGMTHRHTHTQTDRQVDRQRK